MSIDMRPFDLPTMVGMLITDHAASLAEGDVQVGLRLHGGAGGLLFGDARRIAGVLERCVGRMLDARPGRLDISARNGRTNNHAAQLLICIAIDVPIARDEALALQALLAPVLRRLGARLSISHDTPRDRTDPAGTSLEIEIAVERHHPGLPEGTPTLLDRPMRVLYADDDTISRYVMKAMMDHVGAESFAAENGADTIHAWRKQDCDVILLDILMPKIDGVTVARRIRAEESISGRRRTPIVAVTASATPQQAEICRSAGMDALVTKPLELDYLYATISRLTGHRLMRL